MIAFLLSTLCTLPSLAIQEPARIAQLRADEQDKRVARVYDLRDLALQDEALRSTGRALDEVLRDTTERVARLLEAFAPLGEGEAVFSFAEVDTVRSIVGVVGSDATQAWVREWLELQTSGAFLDISMRMIEAPSGHFAELGLTRGGELVPADRVQRVVDTRDDGQRESIGASRLLMRSASRADIGVWDEISYVKDWLTHTVEPGSRKLTVPQIGTLEEGHRVAVLGALLPDGTLGLDVEVVRSRVRRPLRVHDFGPDPQTGQAREVTLPEQLIVRVHTKVRATPGQTMFVGLLPQDDGREVGVLMRTELVQSGRAREADPR